MSQTEMQLLPNRSVNTAAQRPSAFRTRLVCAGYLKR